MADPGGPDPPLIKPEKYKKNLKHKKFIAITGARSISYQSRLNSKIFGGEDEHFLYNFCNSVADKTSQYCKVAMTIIRLVYNVNTRSV